MSATDYQYSITFHNKTQRAFEQFHAEHSGSAGAHGTVRPGNLAPGDSGLFAFNSNRSDGDRGTYISGHVFYTVKPAEGDRKVPYVIGVQLANQSEPGGVDTQLTTQFQYGPAIHEASVDDPAPPFWLKADKRHGYNFIVPYGSDYPGLKVTVENDPHDDSYNSTGKPIYSVKVTLSEFEGYSD